MSQERKPGKYGRLAPKRDDRTLLFSRYLAAAPALPAAPASCDWTKALTGDNLGMLLNDRIGDCTCASAGHMIDCWRANAEGRAMLDSDFVQDPDVLAAYEAIAGYDSNTGANDNGAAELDVLRYWQQTGIAGNRCSAFVAVDPNDLDHVRLACWLFGGVYLGVNMPSSADGQFSAGQPWDTSWWPYPIVGAHAVPMLAYDDTGLTVVTWGRTQPVTWRWFQKYCEEAWAVLDPGWCIARYGQPPGPALSPSGFDMATLTADLAGVQG
jgi:hypothetical protein